MKIHRLAPLVLAAALTAAQAAGLGAGAQDALHAAGPQAAHIVDLWRLTLAICAVVFALVLLAFLYAVWRAPRAQADTAPDLGALHHPERGVQRSVVAAVALSALGLFVLIVASVGTDRALAQLSLKDALHIKVTAHQWWWQIEYDDPEPARIFQAANELHVPVGRPVILTLRSGDVIHSFWVPNLAGKKDLIPGRTATLQFRADKAGVYRGQCAEFCGFQHAWMAFVVVADEPAQYEAWAARQRQPAAPPADATLARGQQLFLSTTCVMCHNIAGTDASARTAPDLTHVGSRRTLAAGALRNDATQLANWISDPQKYKPGANMPGHAFSPEDLAALVAYLRSLQ